MCKSFPGGSVVKNLPANAKDMCFIPRTERSLEKEMATRSSILAWKTPWTEGYSQWGHKRAHRDLATK